MRVLGLKSFEGLGCISFSDWLRVGLSDVKPTVLFGVVFSLNFQVQAGPSGVAWFTDHEKALGSDPCGRGNKDGA